MTFSHQPLAQTRYAFVVTSSSIMGTGWPHSGRTVQLLKRAALIRWFSGPSAEHGVASKLADAIGAHQERLGCPATKEIRVLSAEDGARAVLNGEVDVARPSWHRLLATRFEQLRARVVATHRLQGNPLLTISGEAILVYPEALPISQSEIWSALGKSGDLSLPDRLRRALVDRIIWELGAMILHESAGDPTEPNPFSPLLTVYEEGLYPLELGPDGEATLWSPTASGPTRPR